MAIALRAYESQDHLAVFVLLVKLRSDASKLCRKPAVHLVQHDVVDFRGVGDRIGHIEHFHEVESSARYAKPSALGRVIVRLSLSRERLRPVNSLVDPDRVVNEDSPEEKQRIRQLKKLLAEKDPKVELQVVARRAMSVSAQVGTVEARDVLRELAGRDPTGEMGRLASLALARQAVR